MHCSALRCGCNALPIGRINAPRLAMPAPTLCAGMCIYGAAALMLCVACVCTHASRQCNCAPLDLAPPALLPSRWLASTISRAASGTDTQPTTPPPQVSCAALRSLIGRLLLHAHVRQTRAEGVQQWAPRRTPSDGADAHCMHPCACAAGAVLLDENLQELNLSSPTLVGPRAYARLQRALWSGADCEMHGYSVCSRLGQGGGWRACWCWPPLPSLLRNASATG